MQHDKSSELISKPRKYVPDSLQSAHERSLAQSSSVADDKKLFSQYMNNLRVKRVRK